jgi:hypothetical protein
MAAIPQDSVFLGPPRLLETKTAAIFNSRQSKYPLGSDPWIAATAAAVDFVKGEGSTIITSLGMNTWELVLTLAVRSKIPAIIVLSYPGPWGEPELDSVATRFRLDSTIAGFVIPGGAKIQGRKENWPVRDTDIAAMADVIFPVSIRSGGNLDLLLGRYREKTDDRFRVPYRTATRPRPRYDRYRCSDALSTTGLLIHFTRSVSGPWPDESDYHYYQAVLASHSEYCRSARQTLIHILETNTIRGSSRNIRGGFKAVGFTDASDTNLSELLRYRPRLVNPYFEPYGIGIRREFAAKFDIRPVTYVRPDAYEQLGDAEKAYYQSAGSDGEKWRKENEWRFVGDLCLKDFPQEYFRVIVPFMEESAAFMRVTSFPIIPFFENP